MVLSTGLNFKGLLYGQCSSVFILNMLTLRCLYVFQGTIAVEFLEQVPELDAILVPTSGGGMVAGIAIAAKSIKPDIKGNISNFSSAIPQCHLT